MASGALIDQSAISQLRHSGFDWSRLSESHQLEEPVSTANDTQQRLRISGSGITDMAKSQETTECTEMTSGVASAAKNR